MSKSEYDKCLQSGWIGDFGRYEKKILVLISLAVILQAAISVGYVYTAMEISCRYVENIGYKILLK